MITRAALIENDHALAISKSQGALIGLAVGDAIGDVGRDPDFRARYGLVTHMPDDARSTDDTEFAMLTARALLDTDGEITTASVLEAWQLYILEQGGIYRRAGRPLIGAVENIKRGILPPYSGIDNVMNNDDGAAMRITPVGIVCAGEPERAAEMAGEEAQISHDRDGIWAAQAMAASVAVAMVGGTTAEIIDAGRAQIPDDSWLGRAMERAMTICTEAEDIRAAWEPLHTQLWAPEHAVATEAVPQAYALMLLTDTDFADGMFWSSNFGRDTDTIAAMVGAVAGAKQGVEVVPQDWIEIVRQPAGVCLKFAANEDIISLATALARLIR